jgi:hypothetical protein
MPIIRLSIYAKRTFFKGLCANCEWVKVDFAWSAVPVAGHFNICNHDIE